MRLVLSGIVLLALAANHPCLAKGAHAQHAATAGPAEKSGTKGANANSASGDGSRLRAGRTTEHSSGAASRPAANGPIANNPVANSSMNSSPIDTSITVQPSLYAKRGLGTIDRREPLGAIGQKGGVVFRPLAHLSEPEHSRGLNLPGVSAPGATGAQAAMARHINAVGIAEKDIVGKDAVGNITTSGTGITGKGATNAVGNIATTNAIGAALRLPTRVSAPNIGARNTSPVTLAGPAMPPTAIDGRTITRPGSGAGVIRGPAPKTANGGISGTNFHAKVP